MKRVYEKPAMICGEFVANQPVAAACNTAVSVHCLLTGSEMVFDDGVTGCDNDYITTTVYNGQTYIIWVGPSQGVGGGPSMRLLESVLASAGIYDVNAGGSNVYHAGVLPPADDFSSI